MDKEALFHLALTQSLLRKVVFNCTKTVNIFTFFAYRGGQVSAGLLYSKNATDMLQGVNLTVLLRHVTTSRHVATILQTCYN